MKTKRYKKLMRVILRFLFTEEYEDKDMFEQTLLRFAYHDGYVYLDEDKDFILSDKGIKLIGE